ncbi:MAG TPA: NAD(P)/FAD-dependent oxidoreductase [Kofleriaceae bacterium]|jgi:NADH dehydrogenase|nr:NAD(P)/FAD-dependent oxidoreductase [Kofleriaceae bacterium]
MKDGEVSRPHVVIIGGGFGGLMCALDLAPADVDITLVDRKNHHVFQPLLYQVATGALSPGDIAYPIRGVLRKHDNVRVLLADVERIDPGRRTLVLDNGLLSYDYLVVAAGATHSYFGHDEWAHLAPGLKSVEDALTIRQKIYVAYEAAEREADAELTREWMTFVVVGAGPTGVELAGALSEIGLHTLVRDFRNIDPREIRVVLIEGQDRVLPTYDAKLSRIAVDELTRKGIEVRTDARATRIDERGVWIGDERIPARTVLWAAGVQASPLARTLGVPLDRAGRVLVEPDLSVPGHPEVFVVGDLAHVECDGKPVPGVAQGAIQGGRHAADGIRRRIDGHETLQFRYHDKGSMASIGRNAAIVETDLVKFGGFFAWLFWWVVHIFFLIGFRNRLAVMFSWAWSWLTYQRGVRLITGDTPPLPAVLSGVNAPAAVLPSQPGNQGGQDAEAHARDGLGAVPARGLQPGQ